MVEHVRLVLFVFFLSLYALKYHLAFMDHHSLVMHHARTWTEVANQACEAGAHIRHI